MNETKDEEPSVTDNSVINAPSYFKLFECGKKLLNNIDATYEQACMANLQVKWYTENRRYKKSWMIYKKEKYYTELSNTITIFDDNNDTPLSYVKIRKVIVKGMMEDGKPGT